MSAMPATNQMTYDIIESSELSHYMTLDEMHERLTTNIRKMLAESTAEARKGRGTSHEDFKREMASWL